MRNLEENYFKARMYIIENRVLNSLEFIKNNLEKVLESIKDSIKERTAEIIIQSGLGYKDGAYMLEAFPDRTGMEKREENGVTMFFMHNKNGPDFPHYFSNELGIIIKGEPEERDDGLYCRITGTNLSKL